MSIDKNPKTTTPWWYFLAGSLTALLIFTLGAASYWAITQVNGRAAAAPAASAQEAAPMALFDEAWEIINQDFLGALPSSTERTYGAIRGSMEALRDPYSYFIEPEPAGREQEQLQGHFGGIGAFLHLQEDGTIRLDPMVDRPAALAGVLAGDVLFAVDGEPVPAPADLDALTARLRGPVGTVVRVTVLRDTIAIDFAITRAQIELPSVTWRALDATPGVGYIHIERFSGLTEKELIHALQELRQQGAGDRLILDLRGNPGGLLDAAIAVSGQFLDGGPVLQERRSDGAVQHYNASRGGAALDAHLVVLIDHGTASAAEIVAGALRDRQRARLVGETTFGKGSIQRIHRLSDQSAVHITFARWYTPTGFQIDGQGLSPDILPAEQAGEDPAISAAIAALSDTASVP